MASHSFLRYISKYRMNVDEYLCEIMSIGQEIRGAPVAKKSLPRGLF